MIITLFRRGSIQANNISCTTPEFNSTSPMTGLVMVMIDSATVTNNDVQFTYTPNPKFYSVTPSNTILGYVAITIINYNVLSVNLKVRYSSQSSHSEKCTWRFICVL